MLKYTISDNNSGDDFLQINYTSFVLELFSSLVKSDEYCVTFNCEEDIPLNEGDSVNVSCEYKASNGYTDNTDWSIENYNARVVKVNHVDYNFTIAVNKLKKLGSFINFRDVTEDNIRYWIFEFSDNHTFGVTEDDIDLTIFYDVNKSLRLENLQSVNSYTLKWVFDENYPGIAELNNVLHLKGKSGVTLYRDQFIFQENSESDVYNDNVELPVLSIVKPKMVIPIPISTKDDVTLMKEMNINTFFVENGIKNAVNPITEMEKRVYVPVLVHKNAPFTDIIKINFNIHLREHSGDNWTVKESDNWNNIKLYNDYDGDTFFPYTNNSNQPDLLACLGFTNKDVKYQKNVLKKSFLRLSYFDSMNEADQHLLGYSSIYFDTAKLYSKYMYTHNMPIYICKDIKDEDDEYQLMTGGRVAYEVKKKALSKYITIKDDETIEKYRISSQISVESKWSSSRTSEGFYLYLWKDNDNGIVPSDLYIKIELNHAGFGRTIPFMFPYDENLNKFKTMFDIQNDWEQEDANGHIGYDINKYKKYSYLKFKYVYDKDNGRYVYYLDPDRYGYINNNILSINLYEARISF